MKIVGIIGGLGPETTAEFYLNISMACGKIYKKNRPHILISSVPIDYRTEKEAITMNKNLELVLPLLIAEAKRLEAAGAQIIVMPCNSLHIFIKELRHTVKVPVLSIIEETLNFLVKENYKSVGIIATPVTAKNKLYKNILIKNDMRVVSPSGLQTAMLGKCIINLVNGRKYHRDREFLIEMINDLCKKKIDCILLACTDLQLLIPEHTEIPIIDTMKILADATVKKMK